MGGIFFISFIGIRNRVNFFFKGDKLKVEKSRFNLILGKRDVGMELAIFVGFKFEVRGSFIFGVEGFLVFGYRFLVLEGGYYFRVGLICFDVYEWEEFIWETIDL